MVCGWLGAFRLLYRLSVAVLEVVGGSGAILSLMVHRFYLTKKKCSYSSYDFWRNARAAATVFEENEKAATSIMQYAVSECLAATCFIGNYAEFELLDGKHCCRQQKQEGNFIKSVSCGGALVHRRRSDTGCRRCREKIKAARHLGGHQAEGRELILRNFQ